MSIKGTLIGLIVLEIRWLGQWQIQGEGPGGPNPPITLDACLRLKFLQCT